MNRRVNGKVVLGIPKSLKEGDNRVSVLPNDVYLLQRSTWNNGRDKVELEILVESGAGLNVGFSDEEYRAVGAQIVPLDAMLERSHILFDVKQRPESGILQDGVNIFYMHAEKGQGKKQLADLLNRGGVTAYSPETIWKTDSSTQKPVRACNLGYYSGVGGVHILFAAIKQSHNMRGFGPGAPFHFFPSVHYATEEEIDEAYTRIGDAERNLKIAIIGGKNGLVSSGAQHELKRAGIDFDLLYKDVTLDHDEFEEVIGQYDGIINASVWNPGNPRIVQKRHIVAMKDGVVFIDDTCDEDKSSTIDGEGDPVVGGVRFTYESSWGQDKTLYWVGPEKHTFNDEKPRERVDGTHVLYSAIGMIPGGKSIAKKASEAYFGMMFPYLIEIVRAVSQNAELPKNGMVIDNGKIVNSQLRGLVVEKAKLEEFKSYL